MRIRIVCQTLKAFNQFSISGVFEIQLDTY